MNKPVIYTLGISFTVIVAFFVVEFMRSEPANPPQINANSSELVTKTFSSPELGLRFMYAANQDGVPVLIQQDQNTVYVYEEGQPPSDGQSVQIWTKENTQTLAEAVQQQFLNGYDSTKCFIAAPPKAPRTGVGAVIHYPPSQNTDQPWWEAGKDCPSGYTLTSELGYFWTNNDRAEKFVYLKLQEPFIAGPNNATSWAETIDFY